MTLTVCTRHTTLTLSAWRRRSLPIPEYRYFRTGGTAGHRLNVGAHPSHLPGRPIGTPFRLPCGFYPICHGPPISLPKHLSRIPSRSFLPILMRRTDIQLPPGWVAYSTPSLASCAQRVLRLTAYITSRPAPLGRRIHAPPPDWFPWSSRQCPENVVAFPKG